MSSAVRKDECARAFDVHRFNGQIVAISIGTGRYIRFRSVAVGSESAGLTRLCLVHRQRNFRLIMIMISAITIVASAQHNAH